MLDIPDPYYWRDSKYPRNIYEFSVESHHIYLNGLTVSGKYKYDYMFLWPVPIRVIIPKIAFPWLLERDKWGDLELGDAWIKEREKKNSEKMIEELKQYWGPNRHVGWEWLYAVGKFSITDDQISKFWGRFKSFSEIIKKDNFMIYLFPKRVIWNKKILRDKTISNLLLPFAKEIFDNFPQYIETIINRETDRYKYYCIPGIIERLKLSKAAGFLPKPL